MILSQTIWIRLDANLTTLETNVGLPSGFAGFKALSSLAWRMSFLTLRLKLTSLKLITILHNKNFTFRDCRQFQIFNIKKFHVIYFIFEIYKIYFLFFQRNNVPDSSSSCYLFRFKKLLYSFSAFSFLHIIFPVHRLWFLKFGFLNLNPD